MKNIGENILRLGNKFSVFHFLDEEIFVKKIK